MTNNNDNRKIVTNIVILGDGTIKNVNNEINYDEVFDEKIKLDKISDLNGYKDYLERKVKQENNNIKNKAVGAIASAYLVFYGFRHATKATNIIANYGNNPIAKTGAVIVAGSGCALLLIYAKMILCGDLNFDIRPAVKARKEYKEELFNTQKDIFVINYVHSMRNAIERDFYTELKVTVSKCQMLPEEIKKQFFTLIRKTVKSFKEGIKRQDVKSDSYGSELNSILYKAKNNLSEINSRLDSLEESFSTHQDVDFDNIMSEDKGIKLLNN